MAWMVVARQATELHALVHQSASKAQLVRREFLRMQARAGAAHTHCGANIDCRGRCVKMLGVDFL